MIILQTANEINISGVYKEYKINYIILQMFTNSIKLIFQVLLSHRETGRGPGRVPCHGLSKEGHGHTRADARARLLPRAKSS